MIVSFYDGNLSNNTTQFCNNLENKRRGWDAILTLLLKVRAALVKGMLIYKEREFDSIFLCLQQIV